MNIAISRLHFPVTTLGPGNRIGIWFQGCSIKCVGCISKDTWPANENLVAMSEVEAVLRQWMPHADGVTISGGEPFDQLEQLQHILRFIKTNSSLSTLVYSGHHFSSIRNAVDTLNPLIDALISEPFDIRQTQTLPLRGSDNQQLHFLTALGKSTFECIKQAANPRKLDVMVDEEPVWLVGITEQEFLHRLSAELACEGHDIIHTQTTIKSSSKWS